MVMQDHFNEVLDKDMQWAVFSGMFVFAYIWFHLGSLMMAIVGIISIMFSFPVTYLIYTGVFGVTMNTAFNQLTTFMVLGIAADDMFVFCDAWK